MKFSLVMTIWLATFSIAHAQTAGIADQGARSLTNNEANARSVESERARLGVQRIHTETQVRAREEQRRLEQERERQRTQEEEIKHQQAGTPSAKSSPPDAGKAKDMSRTLEQLRSLGELKDYGYITEQEFEKIKQKILDGQI